MRTIKDCYTLAILPLLLMLAACGDSSGGASFILGDGGNSGAETGTVSIGISDAPVNDVAEVVVEIDKITFRKSGANDVVVDQFTIKDLGLSDVDSFQIDLLDYRGSKQAIVIEDIELASGSYSDMILHILDEDINNSYVVESGVSGKQKAIKVPSDTLKLGSFAVDAGGVQTFTIEFDLRQSMTYRPGPDEYNLKPRGIRIQDNATASTVEGSVNSTLFDTESPCNTKNPPTQGNVVYLYEGHDLEKGDLADIFDLAESVTNIPPNAINPYAATAVAQVIGSQWQYKFAFIPAGQYTLVFSCNAENDDPDNYDGISLPLPDDQLIELTLIAGEGTLCDLPIVTVNGDNHCSN